MKLSLNWLKEFVDVSKISAKEIANRLTMTGSKVETIEQDLQKISKIVVGKVLSVKKHENAEKLVICEVLISKDETIQIVTGAQNVVKDAFVAVCLQNATLADGTVIKYQKLRGVLSQGMMCSLFELGLLKEHFPYAIEDGIFLIEEKCEVGQDIRKALGLDDVIFDFEITSNRPDCLSVYGLAREVAASFSLPLKENKFENLNDINEKESDVKVKINTLNCKRYMAKLVENVNVDFSPLWIRNKLRVNSIKPINNIVDITNYVMLEYGIPMHAYDADKIKNKTIIVRNAKKGEKIKTLDNKEHQLDETDILICDEEKALSIAGVIGGQDSSITKETKNVIFEVACFDGVFIRKTSKKLNVRTDSAIRFEKGLNPICCEETMNRVCDLVLKINAAKTFYKVVDIKNFVEEENKIELNHEFINKFLGLDISKEKMREILNSLGFKVEKDLIKIPPFRVDIKNKEDIAEEIARIYGYDKIPSVLPTSMSNEFGLNKKQKLIKLIKNAAISLGLFEIYSFSFISPKLYEKMNYEKDEIFKNSIEILNPFGQDSSLMRKDLAPLMLETLSHNFRNKNEEAFLFEIGKTYKNINEKIKEKDFLSIGFYSEKEDFYTMKGIVEAILKKAKVYDFELVETKNKLFHPYISCEIIKGEEKIGTFGEVNPNICENFKIYKKTYLAEIEIEKILKNCDDKIKYKPISKFPALTRDLCFISDENVLAKTIEKEIKNSMGDILEELQIFDTYKGDQIEYG